MRRTVPHPDQLPLGFGQDAEIERMIEARVAIRAEAEAVRWRFRLMVVETVLLTTMVIVTGLAMSKSFFWSPRESAMVSAVMRAHDSAKKRSASGWAW